MIYSSSVAKWKHVTAFQMQRCQRGGNRRKRCFGKFAPVTWEAAADSRLEAALTFSSLWLCLCPCICVCVCVVVVIHLIYFHKYIGFTVWSVSDVAISQLRIHTVCGELPLILSPPGGCHRWPLQLQCFTSSVKTDFVPHGWNTALLTRRCKVLTNLTVTPVIGL